MQKTGWKEALRRAAAAGEPLDAPQLTLEGGEELLLERHQGIIEYSPASVTVAAGAFTLHVAGDGLTLRSMDAAALRLHGRIDSLTLLRENG